MSKASTKQKLYCYVDETGQDTLGKFFIVSVVVIGDVREQLTSRLEQIERESGKGKVKWMKVRGKQRLAYMQAVLADPLFKETLHFSYYDQSTKYMALTVLAAARAISTVPGQRAASVYVDGLPKARVNWFSTELRRLGVRTSAVVGVRKEESDPFMRLADACCGFVRQALLGSTREMRELYDKAIKRGWLRGV